MLLLICEELSRTLGPNASRISKRNKTADRGPTRRKNGFPWELPRGTIAVSCVCVCVCRPYLCVVLLNIFAKTLIIYASI